MAEPVYYPDKRRAVVSICYELGAETDEHGVWPNGRQCSHGQRAPHALPGIYNDGGKPQNELSITAGFPRFRCLNDKCKRVFISRAPESCPVCGFEAQRVTTLPNAVTEAPRGESGPGIVIPEGVVVPPAVKRGRGRPKGSLNKKTLAKLAAQNAAPASSPGASVEETPLIMPPSEGRKSLRDRLLQKVADAQADS